MLKPANLLLSDKELNLVSDDSWIMMKEGILQKAAGILGRMPPVITECMKANLIEFDALCIHSPKISRGERYLGLPYLILDFPREFGKQDVFAIRTMFWWANNFTISLHLAGEFQKMLAEKIAGNLARHPEDLYLCVHEDPWQHAVNEINYIEVVKAGPIRSRGLVYDHPFLKITLTIPLAKWNNLEEELRAGYGKISRLFA